MAPIGELAGGGTPESGTVLTIWLAFAVAYPVRASTATFGTSRHATAKRDGCLAPPLPRRQLCGGIDEVSQVHLLGLVDGTDT